MADSFACSVLRIILPKALGLFPKDLHLCPWLQQGHVLSEKGIVCPWHVAYLAPLERSLPHGSSRCLLDPAKTLLLFLQPVPGVS